MGLLGSCLTFPIEKLYYCLVRVLVYLVRTKNLDITYSAHAPNAYKLFARADSNWSERRSTTGIGVFLAGANINPRPTPGIRHFRVRKKRRETFVKRTFARCPLGALPPRLNLTRVRHDTMGFACSPSGSSLPLRYH